MTDEVPGVCLGDGTVLRWTGDGLRGTCPSLWTPHNPMHLQYEGCAYTGTVTAQATLELVSPWSNVVFRLRAGADGSVTGECIRVTKDREGNSVVQEVEP